MNNHPDAQVAASVVPSMTVLSVPEPHATAIVWGIKTVETRSCSVLYRGPIRIHASNKQAADLTDFGDWTYHRPRSGQPELCTEGSVWDGAPDPDRFAEGSARQCHPGHIVGTATIAGCVPIVSHRQNIARFAARRWNPHISLIKHGGQNAVGDLVSFLSEDNGFWECDVINDQQPWGDWKPGRYAILLTDPQPTSSRCPICLNGQDPTAVPHRGDLADCGHWPTCPGCEGEWACDPIPASNQPGTPVQRTGHPELTSIEASQ